MSKKSYNPFKLWGSYVGLVLGIIAGFFGFLFFAMGEQPIITTFSVGIGIIIVGFLIGYGIHALIRRMRK